MFDPHRTRYSNRRFYTRKGQVIQAKRIDAPLGVESRLVPMYKEYILKNKILQGSDFPFQVPILNSLRVSFDSTYSEDIADLVVTAAPTVVTNSIGIAIGTDPEDSGSWVIYTFYTYNSGSFTIPVGFSYKTWPSQRQAYDIDFGIYNDDTFGFSFPLQSALPSVSQNVSIANDVRINKDLVSFE